MTDNNFAAKTQSSVFGAIIALFFALIFTSAGVMLWPILIYAAAPFYFLTVVFFISQRSTKAARGVKIGKIETDMWF